MLFKIIIISLILLLGILIGMFIQSIIDSND
jgi:uncharacterized membrane protein